MLKIIGVSLAFATAISLIACSDDSSTNIPNSNNISCKVKVSLSEDTVITTQKTSNGKTVKTIVIGRDSITEFTQNFYYDDEIKHIFIDGCEDSELQKCGKDNITVYSAPKPKGKETVETIKIAEEKACKAFLSAKMVQN